MGVPWEDLEKFAHVIVVVPDGRIVCQRSAHPSFAKMWQASAYRQIPKYYSSTASAAINAASYAAWAKFELKVPYTAYTHLMSHYVEQMRQRLELVLCKMPSRGRLIVSRRTEIMLVTFEELMEEIDKNRASFAPHTLHAMNVLDGMMTS